MRRVLAGWVLGLAASLACAQLPKEVRTVEGITEYALPNGLTVLLQPDNSRPTTSVNLTYRVGSRHEGYGESGAAHLLEHLLFKATEKIADPKLELTRRGARSNGTTWMDRTNYFAQFPSDIETLDWTLGWLAEAMFHAKLDPRDLASEMTVVRNELERAENNPGRVLVTKMQAAAYQWHAYGRDTLGARSDVENMPIERLRAFYRKHYRPDNAVLVVGGKFDVRSTLERIERTFGQIARPPLPIEPTWTLEPAQDGERRVIVRRVGGTAMVGAMFHIMPAASKDYAAIQILAHILDSGTGPLARNLVIPKLAADKWVQTFAGNEPGYLVAGVTLPDLPEADVETAAHVAATALATTLDTVRLSADQVAQARLQVVQKIDSVLRDPEVLSIALSEAIALGDWRLLIAQRSWVANTTLADVQRVATAWLLPTNRTMGLYLGSAAAPERAPAPARVDAAALLAGFTGRPAEVAAEDFELNPANIEARLVQGRLQVGGKPGLRWAVLPRKTTGDRVVGTLRLRWGTAESLEGAHATGRLLGSLLTQGTRRRRADQITGALVNLDARLTFNATSGGLTADFELSGKNLEPFIVILTDLLQQPAFSDDKFELVRTALLAQVKNARSDTGALAATAVQSALFDYRASDPRAVQTPDLREDALRRASATQLRDFWKRFGGATTGELTLLGPVSPTALEPLLQQQWGDWSTPEPYSPWPMAYADAAPRPWQVIQVADKANANYVGRIPLAITDESADFPALFTAVQLLGGRPGGTALWRRVREEEGLSYGVRSVLYVPSGARQVGDVAAIEVTASYAPQNRDKLRAVIQDELKKRAASGFNALEVGFARRAIASGIKDHLNKPTELVARLANNLRDGRDMHHLTRLQTAYDELNTTAVNAALRKYLNVDRMVEATAGSFAP